jgi:hypothetical protein
MRVSVVNRAKSILALFVAGLLAACQHHPTISYPKLPLAGPIEAQFDCGALDDAILKTEAVRWVMREDGARLLSPEERAGRVTTDVATTIAATFACMFCFSPVSLGDEGHSILNIADRRLVSLLKLKHEKDCPANPTAMAGMTDMRMYETVAELLVREEKKDPGTDVGDLRTERTQLLDKLRP